MAANTSGRWAFGISIALLLAGLLAPGASAQQYSVRWDDPAQPGQHPFLYGNLTANGDQKRISWSPNPATDDELPFGPAWADDPVEKEKFLLDKHLNQAGYTCAVVYCGQKPALGVGLKGDMPAPDEFESDPLLETVHINVTRGFMVMINVKKPDASTNTCTWRYDYQPGGVYPVSYAYWFDPQLDIELFANGKHMGGGYAQNFVNWGLVYPTKQAPVAPDGYGTCYYQIHPEASVLEKGTVLKLKINHVSEMSHYAYGLGPDHRSQIRIALYPPEEVFYRFPELDPQNAESESDVGGGGGTSERQGTLEALAHLALLAGVAAPLAGRKRGLSLLLVLALTSVVLGGCLTSGGKKGGGAAEASLRGELNNDIVKDKTGQLAAGSVGAILGKVHDDLHIPVAGVHVSILGSTEFTQTDGNGRFQFLNIAPGMPRLRFDQKEYRSFEADVEVKAGSVSRPSIMLFLKDAKERDYRPHNHDYWLGATQKDMGTTTMAETCTGSTTKTCTVPSTFKIYPKGDDPNTVMPGTAILEVTLDWDKDGLLADRLGLWVYSYYGNYSLFAPRGPGETFRIATSWEMTDTGHRGYSGWSFGWFVPGVEARTPEEQRDYTAPDHHPGSVTAKFTAYRGGALPLEPAHPDPWKSVDQLHQVVNVPTQFTMYGPPPSASTCVYAYDCTYYYPINFGPTYPKLIPSGTSWVEVTMKTSRAASPTFPVKLYYKPYNVPPNMANSNTLAGYTEAPEAPGSTWDVLKYKIVLKTGQADQEYAKSSGWAFHFRTTDKDALWNDNLQNNPNPCPTTLECVPTSLTPLPARTQLTFTVNVIAHREPA